MFILLCSIFDWFLVLILLVYDVLTGFIKQVIDGHKNIVRDVDWHPVRNEIVSSSVSSIIFDNFYK